MATGTTNPPGSTDPRDLYANAQNLDLLLTGPQPFYPDRLGVQRYSWAGMTFDFNSAQQGRSVIFQEFLADSAFEVPVAYVAGVTLERASQTFVRDGVQYRIKDPADLPYVITGDWATESDNFASMSSDLLTTAERTKIRNLAVSVDNYITEGMTDHSVAFQAAIDTGAPLITCSGLRTYDLASTVNLRSNQTLDLCGSVLNVTSASVLEAVFLGIPLVNQSIINGTINCNGKAISGIRARSGDTGCDNLTYKWLKITGTAEDLTLLAFGGIEIASRDGLAGARNSNVMIAFCQFIDVGTHGALVYVTDNASYVHNLTDGSPNHGMEFVSCRDVVQIGNRSQNCLKSALGVGAGTVGFVMLGNFGRNCGGDGTFTIEHNCTDGVVEGNVGLDCLTSGINVSHGLSGTPERVRNISVKGNTVRQKAGLTNHIGINAYASTGPYMGRGVSVVGNTIDGFTRPLEYAYFEDGVVGENIVNGSTLDFAMKFTACVRTKVRGNICAGQTSGHAYQAIEYAGTGLFCDQMDFDGNSVLASGMSAEKALIYIEGTNTHRAAANKTGGSSHFVECAGAATLYVGDNWGSLTGTPYQGGTVLATLGGRTSLTVGTAGPGAALPATPEGYITVFNPQVGQVKIPYYKPGA